MKNRIPLKNSIQEVDLFRSRIIAAGAFIALFAFALIIRLMYLQLFQHKFYSTLSRQNLLNVIPIEPNRGLIFDRNGVLLAKDIPTYTLAIIPTKVTNLPQLFDDLKKLVGLTDEEIQAFQHVRPQYHRFEPIPIMLKLDEQQVAKFYVNQFRLPGVLIQTRMMRYYPLGNTTSHVVGYVGRINQSEFANVNHDEYTASTDIGKRGVEQYYETLLRGKMGAEEAEINASGQIVRTLKTIPPKPGQNLYLTIDSGLQAAAQQAMGSEIGSIVVLQPSTGQVLAMVSQPSYDPNPFVSGLSQADYLALLNAPDKPLYNRALRGEYASASTIKPFYALLGLDYGVITPEYQIFDPGWFQIPNTDHLFHDWVKHGHGTVNVSRAIMVSCDIFFYNLAMMMGINRVDSVLNTFGFGQKTGIDLPDELPGLVPTPSWKMGKTGQPWYTGDTVVTGIGQGYFLVTPLQLANAVATMANRGQRFVPQVLLKSVDAHGNETLQMPEGDDPIVLKNPQNWDIVINAMQQVVTNNQGTADYFGRNPPYTVAAKTGTAQVYGGSRDEVNVNLNIPKRLRNNHLFIAFAPVDNPQIALAIVVEHAAMADHMARVIMDYYFAHPAQGN